MYQYQARVTHSIPPPLDIEYLILTIRSLQQEYENKRTTLYNLYEHPYWIWNNHEI